MSTLKVVIEGQYDWGDKTANVFWVYGDDANVANGQAVVDAIIDVLMQDRTVFVDDYQFNGGTVYDVSEPDVPGTVFTRTGGALAGTNTNDPEAGQVAALLNFWAYAAKPHRKRVYLAGQSEGRMLDGLWSTGHLAALELIVADIVDFAAASGASMQMACAGPWGSTGEIIINDIDAGRAEAIPATQRRRRRGQGS